MRKTLTFLLLLVWTGGLNAGLQDGLFGYWPMDGDFLDASGNGHDGAPRSGVTVTFDQGKLNQAAVFNGTNPNGVVVGTWNPSEGTGQLALSFWAKWGGNTGGYQGVVSKRNGWGVDVMMWCVEINADTDFISFFRDGSYPWAGDVKLTVGQWDHVVVSFDGANSTFYLNGTQTGTGAFSFANKTDSEVVIGASDSWNGFNGLVDEVAIWNRALSPEEVAALYNNGKGSSLGGEPWQATYVAPADGTSSISLDGTLLQWTTGEEDPPGPIVQYDIYLDIDPDLVADIEDPNKLARVASVAGDVFEFDTGPLINDLTYYWRVDAVVDDVNIAFGKVWSFHSIKMKPLITEQPQNASVGIGGCLGVFQVVATSGELGDGGTLQYQWKAVGSGTVLSTADTLEIAQEGQYYCEIQNDWGQVPSDTVALTIVDHQEASWKPVNPMYDPAPNADGWIDPTVDLTVSWDMAPLGPCGATYHVYLTEDPQQGPWTDLGTTTDLSVVISNALLDYDKTYYVRVDVAFQADGEEGDSWAFDTIKRLPRIVAQPVHAVAPQGGTASFAFGVNSDTPVSYQWFRQEDDSHVADGNPLILTNVAAADEGFYYCIATNDAGPTRSASASFMLHALLAHWPMDDPIAIEDVGGIVADSSGFGHNGTEQGEVASTDGIIMDALGFDGAGDLVDTGTWNPNARTQELTISLWVNWAGTNGGWQALIAKRDTWDDQGLGHMWYLEIDRDSSVMSFARGGVYPGGGAVLPIGQWRHVAVTFDGTTATTYINGIANGSGAFSFGGKTDSHLVLGAADVNAGNSFNGALDDVRLYNYAMSPVEVAYLYQETAGGRVCVDQAQLVYDLNQDCRVNLEDFALLAAAWMECNLAPQTSCQ
ncbi:MAG: hypothetical protein JW828_06695 [Sedimentisphaerales bacterium]|nr:hypothetical protein [Sedimentisphaerales bacterium]